jgi:pantetheine-phosphate adenylyltransferase
MEKVAIFPGSFDPYTRGHHDIVCRGLNLFDRVIIAIGHNSQKKRYFEIDRMKQYIKSVFVDEERVAVVEYDQLTVALASSHVAGYLLRGLRNTKDFEYENSISQINKSLNPELETVFLITSPKYAAISSTIIREVHKYGGDISPFLPYQME